MDFASVVVGGFALKEEGDPDLPNTPGSIGSVNLNTQY